MSCTVSLCVCANVVCVCVSIHMWCVCVCVHVLVDSIVKWVMCECRVEQLKTSLVFLLCGFQSQLEFRNLNWNKKKGENSVPITLTVSTNMRVPNDALAHSFLPPSLPLFTPLHSPPSPPHRLSPPSVSCTNVTPSVSSLQGHGSGHQLPLYLSLSIYQCTTQ